MWQSNFTKIQLAAIQAEISNHMITAIQFHAKYKNEMNEVQLLEAFARLKEVQMQNNIQEMLWSESERLGNIYYLRKAGNWVGADFYLSPVKVEEYEFLEEIDKILTV